MKLRIAATSLLFASGMCMPALTYADSTTVITARAAMDLVKQSAVNAEMRAGTIITEAANARITAKDWRQMCVTAAIPVSALIAGDNLYAISTTYFNYGKQEYDKATLAMTKGKNAERIADDIFLPSAYRIGKYAEAALHFKSAEDYFQNNTLNAYEYLLLSRNFADDAAQEYQTVFWAYEMVF